MKEEDIFRDIKRKIDLFLLLGRRMLGLSSSHNYKEVVNSEFTKLDLIPYYSRPRSSSIGIIGKLHPFGSMGEITGKEVLLLILILREVVTSKEFILLRSLIFPSALT